MFFDTEYVKTRSIRPWKRCCCRPTISSIQPALSRTERHPLRLDPLRELQARRCCFVKEDEWRPYFPRPLDYCPWNALSEQVYSSTKRGSGVCKNSTLKVANGHPSHMRQDITGQEQCCAVKAETECCGSGCWRSFLSRVPIKKLAKK